MNFRVKFVKIVKKSQVQLDFLSFFTQEGLIYIDFDRGVRDTQIVAKGPGF